MKKRYLLLACFGPLVIALLPFGFITQAQNLCTQSVVVQPGNTLSALASEYLGSSNAYPSIVEATNAAAAVDASYATIDSASVIRVGWKLCIPGEVVSPVIVAPETTLPIPPLVVTPTSSAGLTSTLTSPPVALSPPQLTMADDELYPLMIESMRQQQYPGSDLVIEETLVPGANYSRFVASYQSEGLKIFGLLTIPNGERPLTGWPIIAFNHGYIPPEIYRTTERYVAYQDAFARSGYITFKSDYRGHGSSEGENPDGNRYVAYTTDVLNAISSLQRMVEADPERVGMWGHSMGGQITLRAMVVSDDVKVGVIWAGTVANFPTMYSQWQERALYSPDWGERTRRWREELVSTFGTPEENPEFWAAISPNSYLADLSGPVQLQHGSADSSVPIAYSETLNAEILAAGGIVEYFSYAGDDHNLSINLRIALNRSVAFFDAALK